MNAKERVIIHGVVSITSTLELDVFVTHLGIRTENKTAQVDFVLEKQMQFHLFPKF
ncbi:MAG: hypothetical protein ACFFDI_18840 [Promethearchaeota archaeon]